MRSVRLSRLTQLVQRRVSEVILQELKDPRLGFITVSRVKLAGDLRHAVIYYSVVGSESDKSKTAHALEHARGYVQSQVAKAMSTRVTPILRFEYDESVEGSIRVAALLKGLVPDQEDPSTFDPTEEE